jgi:hypothetical protein
VIHLVMRLAALVLLALAVQASSCEGGRSTGPDREREVTVVLEPDTVALLPSQSSRVRARVTGADDEAVQWSSSNAAVATVDSLGTVTAVTAGTATVTATSKAAPDARGQATVQVLPVAGQYRVTITVQTDTGGNHAAINLSSVVTVDVAVDGATVTLTGAPPWVAVTGPLSANYSFVADGRGTVAGIADVAVRSTGRFDPVLTAAGAVSQLTSQYRMGTGGELSGGQQIIYRVEGQSP